jgi:alkanesulfonate monooxygenase SsuD/methylene tetrahydromethanopterin reductase-like flavin-dependent oxidoreductase (luciferase family)
MPSPPLQVGISIIPDTDSLEWSRELVRIAEAGGLALVGVQDHPYQHHFFDTWSRIPMLLAETKRISFFTDVACSGPWDPLPDQVEQLIADIVPQLKSDSRSGGPRND